MPFEGSGTGPGGASWNWSGGVGDMFNALIGNYNRAAAYQVEDMSSMPSRNRIAFSDYQTRNALKNEGTQQDIRLREDSYNTAKSAQKKALLLAEREKRDAAAKADFEKRAALNAIAMRRGLPSGYNAVSGSIYPGISAAADYYEYGAGNPQGRGGGSSSPAAETNEQYGAASGMDMHNCPSQTKWDGLSCKAVTSWSNG